MYRGFNLVAAESHFNADTSDDSAFQVAFKTQIRSELNSLIDADGNISASKIINEWFPEVKASIFISHSHRDTTLAKRLAAWLHKNFGLTSFIDSNVWGYSDELLKKIDNQYCWKDDKKNLYDYSKRNRSTAHVNLMLSTALLKMMNACEAAIFLNTQNAISSKDYIKGTVTASPWIYAEIGMMQYIEKRSPAKHREQILLKARTLDSVATEDFKALYDVDLSHLTELVVGDLNTWMKQNKRKGAESLDSLYKLKPASEAIYG